MKIQFLCGCWTGNIESRENLQTMSAVSIDDEGMLICAIHHQRRKGWRSIPSSENHPGMKSSYFGLSSAEVEGRILFKDPFPSTRKLNIDFNAMPDMRDNRKPEHVRYELHR